MWVQQWLKSPARIYTRSLSTDKTPSFPPPSPHHKHSFSFKDIEFLLHSNYYPSPPSFPPSSPTFSLKDVPILTQIPTRKPSIFHRVRSWARTHSQPPPDSLNKVVIYYTSLHVIRRTFEDCRAVRCIFKGYRVKTDERDLSMDGGCVEEVRKMMRSKKEVKLPLVHVNGKYVGGVDEIRRLYECGELKRLIQGLPLQEEGVCCGCGGYGYVVCKICDGSHKVVFDKNKVRSCGVCNVTGLVKCRFCTCVVF